MIYISRENSPHQKMQPLSHPNVLSDTPLNPPPKPPPHSSLHVLKDMRGNLSFTHLYAQFHPIRAICYDWRPTTRATVAVIFDVRIVIIAGTLFTL